MVQPSTARSAAACPLPSPTRKWPPPRRGRRSSRPAAASCTNPLGPSGKSNAPSRPEATCAAGNGCAGPLPEFLRAAPQGWGGRSARTPARWERRRAAPSGLGSCSRSRPQTVLETVDHLCHRKPSGEEGGAEPTNKRLRPPAGIGAGTATGCGPFPRRGCGGRPRGAGFVRGSCGAGAAGRASPPPEPPTPASAVLLGPLGDAPTAAEKAAPRLPPAPISIRSRLSNARGGLQKLAPGPPSTCPRAAEALSRVSPVPFPPPPSAARSPITGGRGDRLLFKRPRKLRHPLWRVQCTCLPPPRSATLSSSRVLGPASCPQAGGGSGKEVEGIEFLQQMGPFRQDSVPRSTFHIPSLSRICKPGPTTRKACWLPNNSPQLTNTHSLAQDTCTEGLCNLKSRGTHSTFIEDIEERATPPPQFADGAKGCNSQSVLSSRLIGTLL